MLTWFLSEVHCNSYNCFRTYKVIFFLQISTENIFSLVFSYWNMILIDAYFRYLSLCVLSVFLDLWLCVCQWFWNVFNHHHSWFLPLFLLLPVFQLYVCYTFSSYPTVLGYSFFFSHFFSLNFGFGCLCCHLFKLTDSSSACA